MANVTKPIVLDETLQATNGVLGLLGKDATLQSIVTALATIGLNTVGNLASLTTEQKTSLVAAINEINAGKISTSAKGSANGVAELDSNGLVPANQLPSYVDDVLNGTAQNVTQTGAGTYSATAFILEGESTPCTPETGKTYVDITSEIQYRWTGLVFVSMGSNLALGETSTTAYRGDRGKTAYDHSQDANRVTSATATGLYKIGATAQGHIAELVAVLKSDLTTLGLIGEVADSTTNGNIVVDGVEVQVYDDSQVQSDIEDIEDVITTDTTSASGNPLSIVGLKTAQNAINPIVTLEPIQDLHGQDKPYPAGGGKNKLNQTDVTRSSAGWVFQATACVLSAGDYVFSFELSPSGSSTCQVQFFDSNNVLVGDTVGTTDSPLRVTLSATSASVSFYSNGIGTYTKFMVEAGTTKTAYAPYSNTCPITGYDKIEVLSCGKNLIDIQDTSKYELIGVSLNTTSNTITLTATTASYPRAYYDLIGSQFSGASVLHIKGAVNGTTQDIATFVRLYDNTTLISTIMTGKGNFDTTIDISGLTRPRLLFYVWAGGTGTSGMTMVVSNLIISVDSATTYEPYHKTTDLSENLPQTVYGARRDYKRGVLTVDRATNKISDLTWTSTSGNYAKFTTQGLVNVIKKSDTEKVIISEIYKAEDNTTATARENHIYANALGQVKVWDDDYDASEVSDWITARGDYKICYKLATPIEIQLTPTELTLLKDYAYVSTNGTRIDLDYRDGEMATLGDVLDAQNKLQEEIDNPISYDGKNYRLGMDATGLYLYNITDDTKAYIQMVTT